MKLIDIINEKIEKNEKFFSLEFFPPKTEGGVDNLIDRIERMVSLNPLWIDITCGGESSMDQTLYLSSYIQNYLNTSVLMHISCRIFSKAKLEEILTKAFH